MCCNKFLETKMIKCRLLKLLNYFMSILKGRKKLQRGLVLLTPCKV